MFVKGLATEQPQESVQERLPTVEHVLALPSEAE